MSADHLDDATLDLADATLNLHDEVERLSRLLVNGEANYERLRGVILAAAAHLRTRGPFKMSRDELATLLERAAEKG